MPRSMSSAAQKALPSVELPTLSSETKLSSQALALAGVGLWRLEANGKCFRCDSTAAEFLGMSATETRPSDVAEILGRVHPEDRKGLSIRLQLCARTGAQFNTTFRVIGKDGDVRWIEAAGQRMEVNGELVTAGTMRDITKQQSVEESLRQAERKLATVFNQSMVGMLHRDRDLNVLMVNDRFLELVGRTAEELSGVTAAAFTHPEDVARNHELIEEKRSSGEPFTIECRYIRPDGAQVWCEVSVSFVPSPLGGWESTLLFAHDITARKLAEAENIRARDMLALSLDSAGVGTWEVLAADDSVSLSRNAVRIYGLPADHSGKLTRDEWAALLDPESLSTIQQNFSALRNSDQPQTAEFKIRPAEGEERWLRIHGRTKYDTDGTVKGMIGLVYDDSERKQAEIELRESEARLHLIQEAARIGTFVAEQDGVTTGSRQFFRNLGLPEDTQVLDDATRRKLFHPEDADQMLGEITTMIEQGKDYHEIEYRIIRADNGETRWILSRLCPEFDEKGEFRRIVGAHLDITEAKLAALKLQETESLNQGIVDSSPDCIKVLDLEGNIKFISHRGLQSLHVADADLVVGKQWIDMWPDEVRPLVADALAIARKGETSRFNAGRPDAEGKREWWDVMVAPLKNESGNVTQLLSISRDLTEFREQADKIKWSAEHDPLTGIPNRNYFEERMGEILAPARLSGEKIGLLALDVDNFKLVNDAFGHDAGDTLLKTLANRLGTLLEEGDFAARLGGDEFAIVLRGLERGRSLLDFGMAVDAAMREPIPCRGYILDCRVSIGAALSPDHGMNPDQLLKCADTALYAAKTGDGHGNVLLFQRSMRSELDRRASMIRTARAALDRHDIVPYYQPKVCLQTGRIEGFEALLRWRDHSGEVRWPGEIEAAFEDFELAHEISERMLDRVLGDMCDWLHGDIPFGHVAINAAAAEFSRNDFASRLIGKFNAAQISTNHLQIEVTETVFLGRGADRVGSALSELKANGVTIALDDFGTGYASLSHLKRFPVDVLKIDRSFTEGLCKNEGDTAIVCSLINLANELKLQSVAEGIETAAQADFLRRRGCHTGQGYLFGKAVSAAQIPSVLSVFGQKAFPGHFRRFKRAG